MQNAALLWHVSLLVPPERKGLALGMVGLVKVAPIIIFSIVSGVVADAWNRRRLMLFTQTGSAIVAAGLALLAYSGSTAIWPIYALAALSAAVSTFDLPARQALVPMLVPREHLPNAISLNTIMFQTASVAGPALGGVVIATGGITWAYSINAVSFGFVIVALLMMRDVPEREPSQDGSRDDVSWHAALEGLRFVFRQPLIRSTMLLDFFATFFSSATALLPIFAQDILAVGPRGYGWLYAAPAIGAVATSAAMIPITTAIRRRGPVLLWAVAVVRSRHRGVRAVALLLADVWMPGRHRCRRHHQHDHQEHRPPARDAGPAARPDDRRQHGVLRRRTAARRVRGRRAGQLGRADVFGRQRRRRLHHRHRLGRRRDSGAAALRDGQLGSPVVSGSRPKRL